LTDTLAGNTEGVANLVESFGHSIAQTKTHPNNPRFSFGKGFEEHFQLTLEHREAHRIRGHDGLGVFNQVTELAIAVFAEGSVQ
jgi:hypothetical protein